jgi:hypothetical protein
VDAQGKLLARQAVIHVNTGAFAENSPLVCSKTAIRILGPYVYEAVDNRGSEAGSSAWQY